MVFFTAIIAALLVGKAVLITDKLPFMRRFDGAPMIQPILFNSAIYWLCVLIVRLAAAGTSITAAVIFVEAFDAAPPVPSPAFRILLSARRAYWSSSARAAEYVCEKAGRSCRDYQPVDEVVGG